MPKPDEIRPRTWDKSEKGQEWNKKYVAEWKKRNPLKALQYQRTWRKRHLAKTDKQAKEIFMKAHNQRMAKIGAK